MTEKLSRLGTVAAAMALVSLSHIAGAGSAEGGFGPATGADVPPDDPGCGAGIAVEPTARGTGAGIAVEPGARGTGAGAPDCCGAGAGACGPPDAASVVGAEVATGACGVPTTVMAILPLSFLRTKL
jgi:hypothetical protein